MVSTACPLINPVEYEGNRTVYSSSAYIPFWRNLRKTERVSVIHVLSLYSTAPCFSVSRQIRSSRTTLTIAYNKTYARDIFAPHGVFLVCPLQCCPVCGMAPWKVTLLQLLTNLQRPPMKNSKSNTKILVASDPLLGFPLDLTI